MEKCTECAQMVVLYSLAGMSRYLTLAGCACLGVLVLVPVLALVACEAGMVGLARLCDGGQDERTRV